MNENSTKALASNTTHLRAIHAAAGKPSLGLKENFEKAKSAGKHTFAKPKFGRRFNRTHEGEINITELKLPFFVSHKIMSVKVNSNGIHKPFI